MPTTVIMKTSRPDGAGGTYKQGSTYTIADDLAAYFLSIGAAKRTSTRSEQTGAAVSSNAAGQFPSAPALSSQVPVTASTSSSGEVGNLPDPASVSPGQRFFLASVGVGGSWWYSDGTRWRLVGGRVTIFALQTPANGIAQTAAQVLAEARIKAGLLKNGDLLVVSSAIAKSGTTDSIQRTIKIGATQGATNGTGLLGANTAPGGASRSFGEIAIFQRESATTLRPKGNGSATLPFFGYSSAPNSPPVAVPNMDSQDLFLTNVVTMTSGTETPTQESWTVDIVTCGA